ncbi:hypothetical protein [Muribaculum sp. NM65_B17]|uniref:hypothetical protein n=1 Tax=Muribaculum sp. NM65_B17 TaxID=2516961 RepID=UPI001093F09F|nr:hypothetical protein [Muribaculum sp. NM65_B17]TGY05228.1 hypothetical protein E5354_04170 [Muribaculum sp. NM65_B17]THG44533.1 hypothetical protein E5985_00645 [Muribaculaceae bacterium]
MKSLTRYKYYFTLMIALVVGMTLPSCSDDGQGPDVVSPQQLINYTVTLRVAGDTQGSRADGFDDNDYTGRGDDGDLEDPVGDFEKLDRVRLIVTNEAGVVEANYVTFSHEITVKLTTGKKKLYIIGNEGSWDDFGSFASGVNWLSAAKGDNIGDVYSAMLNLSADHSVMEGTRLPITGTADVELTEPKTPEDINQSTEVWLHRAAVKFTFRMRNNTSRKYTVTDLSLGGMSTAMYLMPKGITMGGKDGKTITAFDAVPDAATYDIVRTLAVELPAKAADATDGEWILLFDKPLYALEGKLLENNAPKNYPLSITLDGLISSEMNLKEVQLPRGTHVYVNITLNKIEDLDFDWQIDLVPYAGVTLEPDFGLDADD